MKKIRSLSYLTIINPKLTMIVLISAVIIGADGDVNAQEAPRFLRPRLQGNGQLAFELETLTGTHYRIERSTDLVEWQAWRDFEATEPKSEILVEVDPSQTAHFLRAEVVSDSLYSALNEAREKWETVGWQNYRIQIDVSEFIPRTLSQGIITVENGAVIDVTLPLSMDQALAGQFNYQLSVEGLFERLQDALDRKPHSAEITYHQKLGYPISASIDYDPRIADEESNFRVSMLGPTRVVDTPLALLPNDFYGIKKTDIVDNILHVDLEFGGGCGTHFFALVDVMPGAFAESEPPRPVISLRHGNNGDLCEAILRETRTFDLRPLALSATKVYGNPIDMILSFSSTSPNGAQPTTVLYSPSGTESFLIGRATSQTWVGGVQGSGSGTDYRFKLTLLGQTLPTISELWIGQRRFEPSLHFPPGETAETVTQGDELELRCHFRREPIFEGEPFESEIIDWQDLPPITDDAPTFTGAARLRYELDGTPRDLIYSELQELPELLFP